MYIQPIIEGNFFHIYNRGVNRENLFKEKRNYYFFLQQYKFHCNDVFETVAYCLLKNHFHLVVKVKENVEVPRRTGTGTFKLNASTQLSHFFNSYAQSINKAHQRTGPLFESPFERKLVDDGSYLVNLIRYCNGNAVHHGFVKDIKDWEFSSYHSILNGGDNFLSIDKLLDLFGSMEAFENSHKSIPNKEEMEKYIIE